jgi:hypothetical protein
MQIKMFLSVTVVPAGETLTLKRPSPLDQYRLCDGNAWVKAGSKLELIHAQTHKDAATFGCAKPEALARAREWLNMLKDGTTYVIAD